MTLLHKILEESVLEKIRPTKEEYEKRDKLFRKIKEVAVRVLKDEKVEAEVTLQGSAAKETWIRNNLELDVFVLFPVSTKEWLKVTGLRIIEKIAEKIGKYEIRYAEHPYVRLKVEGVKVDLVPAFKVSDGREAITAVDRTPFHTKWVIEKLNEMGENSRDEVRLLKAFFKGIEVYGAEIKVQGFSGYVTELLVINYGGFAEALSSISQWRPPVFVDPGNFGSKAKFLHKFRGSPMVLPDPVDPNRNAAASVSLESLALASLASWRYITNPSPRFYFKPPAPDVKAERPTYLISFTLNPGYPPETIWGELKRISRSLISTLRRAGFEITRYKLWSDEEKEAAIAIEMINDVLSREVVRIGPPIWEKKHLLSFFTAHDKVLAGPWVEGDRVYLIEPRDVTSFTEFVRGVISRYRSKSINLESVEIKKILQPKTEWLRWFVYGKYWWWT
ncbi:transglycosylase [Ignicoccus islandicus DSM 13165]|uniref:CCA-adding enzyme n=1 Tax=Ignicoccus islandicus DSM 13165 TaxID=940295 RepID=A0A0U3F2G4_9CREN|nr:CCA tRNA nucleotidyltransferase [Ignicoccus islandicus]ALU11733.1 transglycosylase [Ignicoccus islandicus DSM 13165]